MAQTKAIIGFRIHDFPWFRVSRSKEQRSAIERGFDGHEALPGRHSLRRRERLALIENGEMYRMPAAGCPSDRRTKLHCEVRKSSFGRVRGRLDADRPAEPAPKATSSLECRSVRAMH